MHGEMVSVTTKDHLRLHGLFVPSDKSPSVSLEADPIDAAILIHGLGGNFYSSRLLLHLSQTLRDLGISLVLVNTRGHDMINISTWGGKARSVGAALETVSDCQYDLNAWADFLVDRHFENILLLGHSLGAIKSLYAQAHAPHHHVRSIIGLSATRLSYQQLIHHPEGAPFRETIDRCRAMIEAGEGSQLIRVEVPFPTWMTPQCYLEKYGPEEKYNWLRFIDRITLPTLLLFGEKELTNDPVFAGLSEELTALERAWNPITIATIAGADHFYTSKFPEVEDQIIRWLTR